VGQRLLDVEKAFHTSDRSAAGASGRHSNASCHLAVDEHARSLEFEVRGRHDLEFHHGTALVGEAYGHSRWSDPSNASKWRRVTPGVNWPELDRQPIGKGSVVVG
jgi:hypothetical protein